MKARYWLLIGAILICAYVGDMLGRRAVVSNTPSKAETSGGRQARRDGLPAAVFRNASPGKPASSPSQEDRAASPEIASDVTQPERLTPAGVRIDDPRNLDPEEVEERILAEQLAESLRNPAYLQATAEEPSADTGPEDSEEAEAEPPAAAAAGAVGADELSGEQSKQEPDEEASIAEADAAEQPPDSDQSGERPQLTPSGLPIDDPEKLDVEEVENRILAEQLAESLRNPAYLQSTPEESVPEETEEED
jgi:hypothetical protein